MGKTTKQGLIWSIIFSNFKDHFTFIVFGREPCFSNIMLVVVVETSVAVFTTTAKKYSVTMGIVQQSVLVKYVKFPFKPEREMLQYIFKVKNIILVIQFCLSGLS